MKTQFCLPHLEFGILIVNREARCLRRCGFTLAVHGAQVAFFIGIQRVYKRDADFAESAKEECWCSFTLTRQMPRRSQCVVAEFKRGISTLASQIWLAGMH
jgi:hypothetical protein